MKKFLVAGIMGLTSLGALVGPAPAASAASNVKLTSGTGAVLRVKMYEHSNFGGAVLAYYGSGNCTSSTTDTDYSRSSMPSGWNDVVSSWRDYAGCDVKFYENTGFGGRYTYYLDAGSTGKNLDGAFWNDRVSSFKVS